MAPVSSLFNLCLVKVVGEVSRSRLVDQLEFLPGELREKLLQLLSKRGKLLDSNLPKVATKHCRILELADSHVTDVGLRHVANVCSNLVKLDLNASKVPRTSISDAGMIAVASACRHLQIVYLRRCVEITDSTVVNLAERCARLSELNLSGCRRISDPSLLALSQHSHSLKCVNLTNTSITGRVGVKVLSEAKCRNSLQEVQLGSCLFVDDAAIVALASSCPRLKILVFHNCPMVTSASREALDNILLQRNQQMKHVTWTVY